MDTSRRQGSDLVVVALVACSMLLYEILLTRVSALRLLFHYSFLVIGNCLLGLGASGTVLWIFQERIRPRAGEWIFRFGLGYLVAILFVYPFVLKFPIWAEPTLSEPPELARFTVFNLGVAAPFFFAGLVIGALLTFNAARVNSVYGLDLVGAAAGCLLLPWLLPRVGAGGGFAVVAMLAAVSVAVSAPRRWRTPAIVLAAALCVTGLAVLPRLDRWFPVPGKGVLNITEDVTAAVGGPVEYSRWTANSRIDMVPIPESARFIYARGFHALPMPLPEESLVLQDGSAGTYLLNWTGRPETLGVLRRSTYSAAMHLKSSPSVFIIGVGGGNDVWAAKEMGARRVRGIELNGPILEILRTERLDWARGIVEHPGVELLHAEGRSALMRETERYDIVQMTGIDTWTALASGAYMLAENYLYTTEAIESMYDHLEEEGILQIIRMSAEMETLRLLSNIHAAFERRGIPDFEGSVACLETPDSLVAVLVKKGTFSRDEIGALAAFANDAGVRPLYAPGLRVGTRAEQFVRSADKKRFIREFPRDLTPTTDDRPYFFNYTKWRNPFAATAYLDEPTAVSQGNPFFILAQLATSTVLAAGLIVLPLALSRRQGASTRRAGSFLVYFSGLGVGFIGIEIAMMQKLTLFLGHPLYSVTVTLFTLLLFTGTGSLASRHWFERRPRAAWSVPVLLAVLVGGFAVASPRFVSACIGLDLPWRVLLAGAVLAPIGFLLGIPFAYGIRVLDRLAPQAIPWAWAVNGCCTVIGSILTVVLSMNFGFNAVLAAALLAYLAAFIAMSRAVAVSGSRSTGRRRPLG